MFYGNNKFSMKINLVKKMFWVNGQRAEDDTYVQTTSKDDNGTDIGTT